MRTGIGFDAHRFAEGRKLVLGGVTLPHHSGLMGHSDADVLLHAIGDAILGALGLGDLGTHFPDTDPSLAGIPSSRIMASILDMMAKRSRRLVNVDSVIIAQEPRIAPHTPAIRRSVAGILGLPEQAVGIKATTTELMGFTGRGEGIAAMAVVLLTGDASSHG